MLHTLMAQANANSQRSAEVNVVSRPGQSEPQEAQEPLVLEGAAVWGRTPPTRKVAAQTQLFAQGVVADEAYLILQGRFHLRRDSPMRRHTLDVHERGEWLALAELLHRQPYATTSLALEPSLVIVANREMLEVLLKHAPATAYRALAGCSRQHLRLFELMGVQVLEQTFPGLCRGLELILAGPGSLPESQLLGRLRELFPLPLATLVEALRLLDSLNLVKRQQENGREAIVSINEPATFGERVRSFSEQWRNRLPAVLGTSLPREPYRLEELSEILGIPPALLLRRIVQPDFPLGLLRFDPDAVESLRRTHGDAFLKKKVSGRDLLAQIEAVEELRDVDVALLRNIVPRMAVAKIIRLLAGVSGDLREHLLQALSARVRRTVEEEVSLTGAVGSQELGDLEQELIQLCREA